MGLSFKQLIILTCVSVLVSGVARAEWGPWEKGVAEKNDADHCSTSVPQIYAQTIIGFYQWFISPQLREHRCNFTPSCSRYSSEVIKKFGFSKGLVMSFDRFSRCHRWAWGEAYEKEYFQIDPNRKIGRLKDPPEQNDFW